MLDCEWPKRMVEGTKKQISMKKGTMWIDGKPIMFNTWIGQGQRPSSRRKNGRTVLSWRVIDGSEKGRYSA
jgi:hypothetical protein